MAYQSEAALEQQFIEQLNKQGYTSVSIPNYDALVENFKIQFAAFNAAKLDHPLTSKEWERVFNIMLGKSVFQSAKILRDKFVLEREDGTKVYLSFFDADHTKNIFQVTNQTTVVGKYVNRYDVTILVNGLPLIQVELKRRGIDIREAVNQVMRYKKHSYNGLYHFIQLFVVSNGVDTKYFANSDRDMLHSLAFFWTDFNNVRITNLKEFSISFLARDHIIKMLTRYTILNDTDKLLMVMRPYQVYAVEALVRQATLTNRNAYVWHTTGAGKTLTSFKTAQILAANPNIKKVIFLVDRKDLDSQTTEEFNKFEAGSVDATDKTDVLVKQMQDKNRQLIVTTMQKMANAVKRPQYAKVMDAYKDEKVVFIIDECHRSQFGDMHKDIVRHFQKAQFFGFTGTPRFEVNGKTEGKITQTTEMLFGECVHKLVFIKNRKPSWEKSALHDIASFCGGGTPSKDVSSYWDGEIGWISSSDIQEEWIDDISVTRRITKKAIDNSATKLCPEGTIAIVSRVGVGKVAIIPESLCTSQDFTNITSITGNTHYMAYQIAFRMKLEAMKTQGTSIKGVTADTIKSMVLDIPPLEEQKKIADMLTAFDSYIKRAVYELNLFLTMKKALLQQLFIPYFGKRKIGSITETDIQSYISYLYESGRLDKSGGLTVKTIRDVILVLRLAMEYAYKERAIPLLNWDLIEYPKELGVKKVVSLSKDQEQALIQCIYMDLNRKTAGILIALFTGVRIGELCGLQMKDISLTDKTISINKTVQRIYDKKKGESYLHIGPPKTKTSARTIPVPSLLMNIIKKFYTENPNHYFLTGKTKPTEPRTYRQFFSRFLKRNGLQKVKFHEIRHTFAVRAIEIPEFDIKSLSEILGHKNVSFTLNVYGSANLQQKVKCMNLLNDLL